MLKNEKVLIETMDDYILQFSKELQAILQSLRTHIKKCAPEATKK